MIVLVVVSLMLFWLGVLGWIADRLPDPDLRSVQDHRRAMHALRPRR